MLSLTSRLTRERERSSLIGIWPNGHRERERNICTLLLAFGASTPFTFPLLYVVLWTCHGMREKEVVLANRAGVFLSISAFLHFCWEMNGPGQGGVGEEEKGIGEEIFWDCPGGRKFIFSLLSSFSSPFFYKSSTTTVAIRMIYFIKKVLQN